MTEVQKYTERVMSQRDFDMNSKETRIILQRINGIWRRMCWVSWVFQVSFCWSISFIEIRIISICFDWMRDWIDNSWLKSLRRRIEYWNRIEWMNRRRGLNGSNDDEREWFQRFFVDNWLPSDRSNRSISIYVLWIHIKIQIESIITE